MKFIIVDNQSGKTRSLNANGLFLSLAFAGLVGIPAAIGYMSYLHGVGEAAETAEMFSHWRQVLQDQDEQIQDAREEARNNLEASALRLAQLQARIVRLDALGERLTTISNLDAGEFDFSGAPALGGPQSEAEFDVTPSNYLEQLDRLSADLSNREQQLDVLETLLVDRKIQRDVFIAGRPVKKGWLSSRFGERIDPITGKLAWHNGVDFAGKEGAEVVTVAAGVVVYAAHRSGYGKMVEVNHGGGFSTRYGHHKEIKVKVGDIVKKGQVIALMGNTGRSTGPHVHFEVFKNGRVVDPSTYIHRASR
jgi:murein DD-endopeptidase MepM/ murein hydrolase activator NlpD